MRVWALFACLTLATACVDRTLTVVSDPPGARVYLDTVPRGFTPLTLHFPHYGIRRVDLVKPGYERTARRVELKAPWYERWGFSLFSSVLWPGTLHDEHGVNVTLVPLEEEDHHLEERAKAAREALGP